MLNYSSAKRLAELAGADQAGDYFRGDVEWDDVRDALVLLHLRIGLNEIELEDQADDGVMVLVQAVALALLWLPRGVDLGIEAIRRDGNDVHVVWTSRSAFEGYRQLITDAIRAVEAGIPKILNVVKPRQAEDAFHGATQ